MRSEFPPKIDKYLSFNFSSSDISSGCPAVRPVCNQREKQQENRRGENKEIRISSMSMPIVSRISVNLLSLQIIATETGPGRQSTSADVIVNVLDINDNPPVFSQQEYRSILINSLSFRRLLTFL